MTSTYTVQINEFDSFNKHYSCSVKGSTVAIEALSSHLVDHGVFEVITADGCDGEYVSYTIQADNTNYDVLVVWED